MLVNGMEGVIKVDGKKNKEDIGLKKGDTQLQERNTENKNQGDKGQKEKSPMDKGHGKGGENVEKGMAGHDIGEKSNGKTKGTKGVGDHLNENNKGFNKGWNASGNEEKKKTELILLKSKDDKT
jgi:hypothetical protein